MDTNNTFSDSAAAEEEEETEHGDEGHGLECRDHTPHDVVYHHRQDVRLWPPP